jgi:hypothetical protein
MTHDSVREARRAMIMKRFNGNSGGATMVGGKRRKKAPSSYQGSDLAKMAAILRKHEVIDLANLIEVNLFIGCDVIQITEPQIKACVKSNSYLVFGKSKRDHVTEFLPAIQLQMTAEAKKKLGIREAPPAHSPVNGGFGGGPMGSSLGGSKEEAESSDDDDIPELLGDMGGESDEED